ncbi:hypothetical protein TorRG33x02_028100, partial [Trema orientale]
MFYQPLPRITQHVLSATPEEMFYQPPPRNPYAVNAIMKPKLCYAVAYLDDISIFISSAGYDSCCHVSCQGNIVAHELTQFAIRSKCNRIWDESCPYFISHHIIV